MEKVQQIILVAAFCLFGAAVVWFIVRTVRFYRKEHFLCPKCGCAFRPALRNWLFSVNAVEGKILRCPRCKEKEYMEPVPTRNDTKLYIKKK